MRRQSTALVRLLDFGSDVASAADRELREPDPEIRRFGRHVEEIAHNLAIAARPDLAGPRGGDAVVAMGRKPAQDFAEFEFREDIGSGHGTVASLGAGQGCRLSAYKVPLATN